MVPAALFQIIQEKENTQGLPTMNKALGSIPSKAKNGKRKKKIIHIDFN